MRKRVLVIGGAGFIGSNFVSRLCEADYQVYTLDNLTGCGNLLNLDELPRDGQHTFFPCDMGCAEHVDRALKLSTPAAVFNFATEVHLDSTVKNPKKVVERNYEASRVVLEGICLWLSDIAPSDRESFRYVHISSSEVFGTLNSKQPPFTEDSVRKPDGLVAQHKARVEQLVQDFHDHQGLPSLILHCSDTYGPRQVPKKLIPWLVYRALEGEPLRLAEQGDYRGDWLNVEDLCDAIFMLVDKGKAGDHYCVGAGERRTDLEITQMICERLNQLDPLPIGQYEALIDLVENCKDVPPLHTMNDSKLRALGWKPRRSLSLGIEETVRWYVEHPLWLAQTRKKHFDLWLNDTPGGMRHYDA